MKLVDFSTVVFADSTGVLVKSDMGINSFDGMAGRKIGIIAGSTNARAIRGRGDRFSSIEPSRARADKAALMIS
jgi:ABC-type amino acid transport substrate-binding protein